MAAARSRHHFSPRNPLFAKEAKAGKAADVAAAAPVVIIGILSIVLTARFVVFFLLRRATLLPC